VVAGVDMVIRSVDEEFVVVEEVVRGLVVGRVIVDILIWGYTGRACSESAFWGAVRACAVVLNDE
jgi:hypothetical protein